MYLIVVKMIGGFILTVNCQVSCWWTVYIAGDSLFFGHELARLWVPTRSQCTCKETYGQKRLHIIFSAKRNIVIWMQFLSSNSVYYWRFFSEITLWSLATVPLNESLTWKVNGSKYCWYSDRGNLHFIPYLISLCALQFYLL